MGVAIFWSGFELAGARQAGSRKSEKMSSDRCKLNRFWSAVGSRAEMMLVFLIWGLQLQNSVSKNGTGERDYQELFDCGSRWRQKFITRGIYTSGGIGTTQGGSKLDGSGGIIYFRADLRGFLTGQLGVDRGESECSKSWGRNLWSMNAVQEYARDVDVAEMEAYDAVVTARKMSKVLIEAAVAGLDRAELMEWLNLQGWQMAADIKGVHPASLIAPKTLKIHAADCPFLEAGISNDCCTGAVLGRAGHLTVSLPCYRTDILADSSVCAHCEQLWASENEEGMYELKPEVMDKAAEFYTAGKTGVMKKWPVMVAASEAFDSEVTSAKEIFADSEDELDAAFPEADFQKFCKQVLNDSGVVFAEAGRARNPFKRSAEQQERIGAYVQRMAVLWVRVKAAVEPAMFETFVRKLQEIARRVENAARWTVQKAFPAYPVFVGPLVCADVMLAGFAAAEERYHHQVGRVMQNSQEARDRSHVTVSPVLQRLDKWAKTVKPVRRASPVKRRQPARKVKTAAAAAAADAPLWNAAASPPASVAKDLKPSFDASENGESKKAAGASAHTPARSKGKYFYGVARGFTPGVYASWEEANEQVKNFSGSRIKKFKSEDEAKQWVDEIQANPVVKWYVLKGTSRADGAYACKAHASQYRTGRTQLVVNHSLTAAKRFLGTSRLRVYRQIWMKEGQPKSAATPTSQQTATGPSDSQESAAAAPDSQRSAASADAAPETQFFAIRGGSEDGVYKTLKEVLAAVKKGGGAFEVFSTEAEAAEYCRPEDSQEESGAEDMFVVWKGKSTGVMSATECVKATAGVAGARAEGPMSLKEANEIWKAKQTAAAPAAGDAQLQHVEYPSDDEWAKVANSKQTRVFACWVAKGKGRIAFSWEAAAKGVKKNLSVQVFSAESTVFLNFARAEEYLANTTVEPSSVQEKIKAARKAVAKNKKTSASSKSKPFASSSSSATSSGQSVGARIGMSGVVHTREVTQIRRCFIDAAKAIVIRGAPEEPDEDELERDLPAPGSATYLREEVEQQTDGSGELTLLEYFQYKKSKVKAWPLKGFDEFLAFCRQGQRLCAASSKEVAVANAAMFLELSDIAVKTHMQMMRRGTLGYNEERYKVRMYMHLQHATNSGVLYTGQSAMRAFEASVDVFGLAKVPRFMSRKNYPVGDGKPHRPGPRKGGAGKKPEVTVTTPATGCYLCAASDHYASDPKFHPRGPDGKRPPVSAETKKAIFARIDASSLSAELKHAEKTQVKKYWAQHSL